MLKQLFVGSFALLSMISQATFADTEIKSNVPQATGKLFSVSTIGNQLTINTTIPGKTYQFAGITSLTPGFSFAPCPTPDNGYCLYTVSDTLPANPSLVGNTANPTFKLCLDGAGKKYSCEKKTIGSRFAYMSILANEMRWCSINSKTKLFSCTALNTIDTNTSNPRALALSPNGKFIYQANQAANQGGDYEPIAYCQINATTGAPESCAFVDYTNQSEGTSGIVIDPTGRFLYMLGATSGYLYTCNIPPNGNISTCTKQTQITFKNENNLNRITLNSAATFAYVTLGHTPVGDDGAIFKCPVDPTTGVISNCINETNATAQASAQGEFATGITLNPAGNLLYFANHDGNNTPPYAFGQVGSITKCTVAPITGELSNCTSFSLAFPGGQFTALDQPSGVHFNSTGTILYISNEAQGDQSQGVVACPVDSAGNLSTCFPAEFTLPGNVTESTWDVTVL